MKLENRRLSNEEFMTIREEVLNTWETGAAIKDLQANIEYAKSVPREKNFALKLQEAKNNKQVLTQPRAGVALISEHLNLLKYLSEEGEADLLPTTVDSYTRQNRYENCTIGIKESVRLNRSMLNGFPVVNHGVSGCRKIQESLDKPVQARHGTPDARLLSEIIHASGWTSNEGGGISYNIPYSKDVPLERTIKDWQYCDRLAAIYEEHGVPINREPFGPLTGTLVPPSMSNSVAIIEALLAAEQGVKHITVGYGQCGNQIQDIAAIKALEQQTDEYLLRYGYRDTVVTTVFHQWMGGFPKDESKAYAAISNASVTAAMAKVTKVIVKTPHEAFGIPTKQANANGLKCTKMVLNLLADQKSYMSKKLSEQIQIIKEETKCILEAVFEVGDGDLARGVVEAFKRGILDIPFAPSIHTANKLLPARDHYGAVRYLDCGNIPFTDELKAYNRRMLEKRAKIQNRPVDFQMTVDDIFAVSEGKLVGKPEITL
ncbi:methylaspartate mutase subunit E [Haloplasma contractile]|uniref:Glutamate mutase epsilon subunit n=1 Tax=Haloplasma contractile SSD-17B TaxID=1033810 RepID=U2E0A0_9MOLU|nr:methylaspartate mutase subunit E [Haloplasma contractile]ERJ13852.1 methylaspartate mutase protein [Haloplasma contractile SSD-17B]